MKWPSKLALLCLASVWALSAMAANPETEADPLAGTDSRGYVTFSTNPDGSASVTFAGLPSSGMPEASSASMVANVGVASGAFVGDYIAAGIRGLTLKLKGDGHVPQHANVYIETAQRVWYNNNVVVSGEAGEWTVNNIAMNRAAGWDRNERPGVDKDALWADDLKDVRAIGVRLAQGSLDTETYAIADFMLSNDQGLFGLPAVLSLLEQALYSRFGVTDADSVAAADRDADTDADGMSDLDEILSQYDLSYANSIFMASIVDDDGEGVLIKWPCVINGQYMVFRATSLLSGFSLLSSWESNAALTAQQTGYMLHRDLTATGKGPYFYRILRQELVGKERASMTFLKYIAVTLVVGLCSCVVTHGAIVVSNSWDAAQGWLDKPETGGDTTTLNPGGGSLGIVGGNAGGDSATYVYSSNADIAGDKDYAGDGIQSLVFDFYVESTLPGLLQLYFMSNETGSDHYWTYDLNRRTGWNTYRVNLVATDGWRDEDNGLMTQGAMDTDLAGVDEIGILLTYQPNMAGQTFGIDNFGLDNEAFIPIPEPETYAMLGFALLSVAYTFRRKLEASLEVVRASIRS